MALSWWLRNEVPEAFALDDSKRVVAFCGAGGKSSAMAKLASVLRHGERKVILSTTTHVYSNHLGVSIPNVIRETFDKDIEFKMNAIGIYDRISPEGKLKNAHISEIMACINMPNALWLVEADGARHAYVKAPLAHEPQWPPNVDLAVGCFSAQILGQSFEDACHPSWDYGGIHRPEVFSKLTGINANQIIDEISLKALICHEAGMFRGLPKGCPRVVIATQVKKVHLPVLKRLGDCLDVPLVLIPYGLPTPEPVKLKPQPNKLIAAVMAGGKSQRMGKGDNKLFMKLSSGKTVLEASLSTPLELKAKGLLDEVILISGHDEAFQTALRLGISYLDNPKADLGISEGLKQIARYGKDPSLEAVFICMGDQPLVSEALMNTLANALFEQSEAVAAIPTWGGQRLSPVLIRTSFLENFETLSGDSGAKALLKQARCVLCPWDVPEVFKDIDTIEDFQWLEDWLRRAEGV